MVEQYDDIYELYVHYCELYDEIGSIDEKKDEAIILYKAIEKTEECLTKLCNKITNEFLL
jgi:hypothetical protein